MSSIQSKTTSAIKQIPKDIAKTASEEFLNLGKSFVTQATNQENNPSTSQQNLSELEQNDERMKNQRLRLIHEELLQMGGAKPKNHEPGPLLDPFGEKHASQDSLSNPFGQTEQPFEDQPEALRQAVQKTELGRNMKG